MSDFLTRQEYRFFTYGTLRSGFVNESAMTHPNLLKVESVETSGFDVNLIVLPHNSQGTQEKIYTIAYPTLSFPEFDSDLETSTTPTVLGDVWTYEFTTPELLQFFHYLSLIEGQAYYPYYFSLRDKWTILFLMQKQMLAQIANVSYKGSYFDFKDYWGKTLVNNNKL